MQPETERLEIAAYGGGIAWVLVDAADVEMLAQFHWRTTLEGYAVQSSKRGTQRMHRMLLGMADNDGRQVDHINRDKLDNRRANLREVTNAQNHQNLPAIGGTSRFRGVCYERRTGMWLAQVGVDNQQRFVGRYSSEMQAAQMAESFRLEHLPFAEPDPELARLRTDRIWARAPRWMTDNQWAALSIAARTLPVRASDIAHLPSPAGDGVIGADRARSMWWKLRRRGFVEATGVPGAWRITQAGIAALGDKHAEDAQADAELMQSGTGPTRVACPETTMTEVRRAA